MVRFTPFAAFLLLLCALAVAPASGQDTQRRILLEEFSTAQCGFCPDGDVIAARIVRDHPSVIWVTHHAGFGVDSMTAQHSATIANAFVNFAPSGVIDRVLYPKHVAPYENLGTIRGKWDSLVTAHLGDAKFAEVRIVSTYHASTSRLDCAVEVTFSEAPAPGDFRVHLFVVEDSIIGTGRGYDQTNYFNATTGHTYYGAGDPIVGYAHHRVVSAIPSGAWGIEGVIPSVPETGKTYSWNWTGDLSTIWDKSNIGRHEIISLVAFVAYHDDDPLRRRIVHAGEARITNVILDAEAAASVPADLRIDTWPNPATDRVDFRCTLAPGEQGTLLVSDAAGRGIATMQIDADRRHRTLLTAGLPAGLYFTRLLAGGRSTAGKFVVMH